MKMKFLIGVAMGAFAGCAEPQSGASSAPATMSARSTTAQEDQTSDLSLHIPDELVFLPSLRVATSSSWNDSIANAAGPDKQMLEAVGARYNGALYFRTKEEQAELARQGFPMPEEWIAASRMSVEELESLAEGGNLKARMFYSDRVSSQLAAKQSGRKPGMIPEGTTEQELIALSGKSLSAGSSLMRDTGSPFAAYLYGVALSSVAAGAPLEPIAGSFFAARDRGDTRANGFMRDFTQRHPQLNMQSVMAVHSTMASLKPASN